MNSPLHTATPTEETTMDLGQIVDDSLTQLSEVVGFKPAERDEYRARFVLVWLTRVGKRVEPLLTAEETECMQTLLKLGKEDDQKRAALLEKLNMLLSQDSARQERMYAVFEEEAAQILARIVGAVVEQAGPEQRQQLARMFEGVDTKNRS